MLSRAFKLSWGLLLLSASAAPVAAAPAAAPEAAWKDKSFIERAEAVKRGGWDKARTRDVAIVGLFEVGRKAEKIESQLSSDLDRLYALAYWGALILGAYLILQLLLSLVIAVRLGRLRDLATGRGTAAGEDYRL